MVSTSWSPFTLPRPAMRRPSLAGSPAPRRQRLALACLVALVSLATACVPSPTSPASGQGTVAAARLDAGAYHLRTIDGQALPVVVPGGVRIESGFLVADSADTQLIGWGESAGRDNTGSVRLATGTARVLAAVREAHVASITWRTASATADSVSWSRDSVIVHRSGAGLSAAGAGHRLVYTRATEGE